ncbi:unnamed protein product [Spodoptera littoralis]|uniref:DUF7869 domain-containing protein n=1 Tax=Spodoptera littoralis TaxID=7109 RepID=A0A9P0N8U7_SPOLI|nr:unnamed protein product [Spodoptera littoralis]CAH1645621.1 unnamed protein product [Spodoptera littoralis]
MEPKRLKYLRSKIERISEENENKTKSLQPSTKRRFSVTLLDSSSYHDQNKDLRIFNTFDDKFNSDPKTITNYEEYDEESQKNEKDNVKSMDKPTKILELEEHEQNTKNPNNVNQVIAKHMAQDTVIEMSDKIRTDSNESLQPTLTEIIPEKEMDILRKSLEEDNNAEEITTEIPNRAEDVPKKVRKSKRTVIQKSYLDFMSEDEDFVWDSTSWEGTDKSSSDDDDQPKKKKLNVEDGKKCGEIDDEKRRAIFDFYWGLSNQRKKEWLIAMSSKEEIKRKRSKLSSYRTNTFKYFINDGEGRRQQKTSLKAYLHYRRIIAARIVQSCTSQLNSKTSKICKGLDVLSEKIFRLIFSTDFNIGFHVPKKDKCIKCLRFEGQKPSECPELHAHLEEKQASKQRQQFHRELGKENPTILCASFDLQKVLNTPHGNSMLLFYSRKYTVYNLCFYESITRNGFCFVWGETEGKRGANEIGTILQKYIEDVDSRTTIKTLILYSDSCPGQNKNKIVLPAVHNALLQSKHLETIQMNFLLPGHTEMTVDSIHSTIEQSVRNTIVWAPSQWVTVCQLARKEPAPYYVENLTHTDFKNFEEFSDKYFKGNLVGKISKIRTATFKKSNPNEIKIKYTMKNDALEEKIPIHAKPKSLNLKYKTSLAITKSKYNDLKKLCDTNVIPKIFHSEYLNLQTNNAKDQLVDTDIEDETEELD